MNVLPDDDQVQVRACHWQHYKQYTNAQYSPLEHTDGVL